MLKTTRSRSRVARTHSTLPFGGLSLSRGPRRTSAGRTMMDGGADEGVEGGLPGNWGTSPSPKRRHATARSPASCGSVRLLGCGARERVGGRSRGDVNITVVFVLPRSVRDYKGEMRGRLRHRPKDKTLFKSGHVTDATPRWGPIAPTRE